MNHIARSCASFKHGRSMAHDTSAVAKSLFVLFAEDKPNSLELRMKVRPDHLEYIKKFDVKVGGPTFTPDGKTFNGSMLIVSAKSLEEVQELARNDPYTKVFVEQI
eukprot:TRINITY_DN4556_c0_g1_i2.p1 TRINITY_DN4556_c0_g1~~TRINITY_DN4556_c0_g1_i2.p1  ORF type:complete len:106 (+),score=24.30 TRINITY_DN4556_c0_g1_i2:69-386(+)